MPNYEHKLDLARIHFRDCPDDPDDCRICELVNELADFDEEDFEVDDE